jgi:heat-inducible transcriptional repressor
LKTWKPIPIKHLDKQDRERKVLLGLVDYYIQTGQPVGSNTLKEAEFKDLSSATIRNYFSNLEKEGYLIQSHSSAGRIPTPLAYRAYVHEYLPRTDELESKDEPLQQLQQFETREIALFLQEAAEQLSQMSQCAVFLSAPHFDHDFVVSIKLVPLDALRYLCVLITDFGVVQTEVLHFSSKLSSFAIKRIETYFHWRLTGVAQPENLSPVEEAIAQNFYHELMLRYIVSYSNFIDEDIYRTGFSRLLNYPEFQDTNVLANGLALFENIHGMRLLLKEGQRAQDVKVWIGDDLACYVSQPNCSILMIPYFINRQPIGVLGPLRMPYRHLFTTLRLFSGCISKTLTRIVYKFKIPFRQPNIDPQRMEKETSRMIGQSHLMLLENKRTHHYEHETLNARDIE